MKQIRTVDNILNDSKSINQSINQISISLQSILNFKTNKSKRYFYSERRSDRNYGGEEFGIIFKSTDGEKAFTIMERIRRSIEKHDFVYDEKSMPVAISIGISTLAAQNYANAKALVKAADDYLYKAKGSGRNRTESAIVA